MGVKRRLKVCIHCNAEVDLDVIVCPYCGANLMDPKTDGTKITSYLDSARGSAKETESSLYPPPYMPRPIPSVIEEDDQEPAKILEEESEPGKSLFFPVLLLSLGTLLLLLGIFSFFFSSGGILRLEWDAKFWFVYMAAALPLIYIGVRKL